MKLIDKIKNHFKKDIHPKTKYDTVFAFRSGGIDYFQFPDFNNTPAMRGLKTMVFYEEMKMKCTVDFLRLHVEAVDNILMNKQRLNIYEIKKLNDQLKQRLDIAIDTELIYKIASIVFFPADENVEDYDFGYNARKIDHWKKHDGHAFFLHQPLKRLIPVLNDMSGNLESYSEVVEKLNSRHLGDLLRNLDPDRIAQLKGSSYTSLGAMPPRSKG